MRHLITGGAGFIGSALANRLHADGHEVIVLDRFSRGKPERLSEGIVQMKGDVRSWMDVAEATRDVDCIWHLAYVQGTQTFYADPKDVIDVALRGIVNVLSLCNGSMDFILVSSSEVYQNPPEGMYPTDETVPLSVPDVTNPRYSYGGGKIASELATLAYSQAGLIRRAMIVRPHNIYGPDMGNEHVIPEFAERMKTANGTFQIQGTGEETRSFCYIDDCIDGLLAVYEKGEDRNVYHLGNPAEEHSIARLAFRVARYFGKDIAVLPGELPKGSPTRRKPDIRKLAALGYAPKVPLSEGLPKTLDWYA